MPKWRMTQVMAQANRLHEVFIGAKSPRQAPPNLGHFQGVGETGAIVVAFVVDEDLRLVLEAAKSRCVQDPVPIALKRRPVFGLGLGVLPAAALAALGRVSSKRLRLYRFPLCAGDDHIVRR